MSDAGNRPSAWPDLAGRLTGAGHILPVRIYYEDTDFSGVVYHAAYLKFLERGRSDFLRLCGIHHNELDDGLHGERLAFAARRMEIDFLKPARIDDVLEIVTVLEEAKGARIVLRQEARRDDEVLMAAQVTIAVISRDGKPRRLPAGLAERLRPAAGDAGTR
ncbi:tol-pal system-associated acyl-CoA thioesterase [Stappia sp. F7233]|uniref:Tol-pal system-associated acyl-CoA thioesterase n=1 Tax=Stappia albiluteola TaxID=2758565 RepID=A0A839ADQ7_9HYPH|nr:tol-pal system-associated acyl-CoA thioesterase [Stappia albiluteola]MBA5777265.1 tol-pal system-associated acyl-CoA thioesterase [Stappia albiluteola]